MPSVIVSASSANTAELRIATDPPGASIFRNGRLENSAPLTLTDLPPGDHLIAARLTGYHEERVTATLNPGERLPLDIKLRPVTGLLLFHSNPSQADVEINGAHRGTTPLLVTDIPIGVHRAMAVRPGYLPMEIEFSIEGRTPQKIEIELRPDAARLHFESEPDAARVFIDGVAHGTTPCQIDRVPSGERRIEVRLEGHQSFMQTFQLDAGDERRITARLEPLPGALSLTSIPEGARIYIDNQRLGVTPLQLDDLSPGTYTVRAESRGFAPAAATLRVQRDTVTSHEFRLHRNSGSIVLSTEPARVRALLDGREAGITEPGASDVLSQPLTIDFVARGTRKLQLSREGYDPLEREFDIQAGQTITLHETLRRKFIPDTRIRIGEGPRDVFTGIITQRNPDGSIEIETRPGIFRTFTKDRILAIEPIRD